MIGNRGAFGGTAQRSFRIEDETTEKTLPLKLAMWGVLGAWIGIAFSMLLVGLIGPVSFTLSGIATGLSLWWWWWRTMEDATDEQVRAAGLATTTVLAGVGALIGMSIFRRLHEGLGIFGLFVECLVFPLTEIPPALWGIMVVLPALAAFRGKRSSKVMSGLVVSSILGWSLFRHLDAKRGCWPLLLEGLVAVRLLFVPYCLPPIAFAMNVVARNWIEALIGSVWPPQFERVDLRWSGILGLVFPRRFLPDHPDYRAAQLETGPEAVIAEYVELTVNDKSRPGRAKSQRHRIRKPMANPEGLANFARALLHGLASFSEKGSRDDSIRGATHYGYTYDEWVELRDAFEDADLADKQTTGNAVLNQSGWGYLTKTTYRAHGLVCVPEQFRVFLDLPVEEPEEPEDTSSGYDPSDPAPLGEHVSVSDEN
jgi:hypothetical protein